MSLRSASSSGAVSSLGRLRAGPRPPPPVWPWHRSHCDSRSEEHTSELQSLTNLVGRLLLEKNDNFGDDLGGSSCRATRALHRLFTRHILLFGNGKNRGIFVIFF